MNRYTHITHTRNVIYIHGYENGAETRPRPETARLPMVYTYVYNNNNKGTTATIFFLYTYNNIIYTFVFMRSVETIIYVETVVGGCGASREQSSVGAGWGDKKKQWTT